MGDWLFGCDVCQDVCPYNQTSGAADGTLDAFEVGERWTGVDAAEFLQMTAEGFRAWAEGSPVKRAGHEGLARNMALVLGNRGEKVHLPLLDDARRLVTPHLVLTCRNSEIGAVANMPYEPDDFAPGRVGRPFDDLDLAIVDEGGEPVAAGTEGYIRMRRENVVAEAEYLNTDGAGGERFDDGWFYPGDLGYLDADGMLVISGRDDNVINIGGNKFSIEVIESEIEAKENCRCAVIRGNGDDDGEDLALVVSADGKVAPQRIARFAGKRFPRLEFAAIYEMEELDLTESGKPGEYPMVIEVPPMP